MTITPEKGIAGTMENGLGKTLDKLAPDQPDTEGLQGKMADRRRSHWERWEIGALLTMLSDRHTTEEVAGRLGRPVEGIRRQYERLLAAQVECPAEYQAVLARLQALHMRGRDAAGRARPGRLPAAQLVEQYRSLALRMTRMEEHLESVIAVGFLNIAMGIAGGHLNPDLMKTHLPESTCRGITRLAADIAAGRATSDQETPAQGKPGPAAPLLDLAPGTQP